MSDATTRSRQAQREILILSAVQTLGSALQTLARVNPRWVVVLREESWSSTPLLYAFRPKELLGASGAPHDLALREALALRETDASSTTPEGVAPPPPHAGGTSSSLRTITLSAEGVPTRVTELATAAAVRRGARRRAAIAPPAPERAGPGAAASPADALTTGRTADDTIEMRLAAQAPTTLGPGADDIVEVSIALATEAIDIPGAVKAKGSSTEQIAALITIFGDAVVCTGPRVLKLDPPKSGKPSQNVFEIHAEALGTAQLAVMFRQGGTELGSIHHEVRVVENNRVNERAGGDAVAMPRVAEDSGVLLLQVDPKRSSGDIRYQYRVHCPALGQDFAEFESPRLLDANGNAADSELAFVRRIYENMTNKVLRSQDEIARFRREVSAFGQDLCAQLFPLELVRILWEGRQKISAVRVMSWEPYLPWELVKLAIPAEQKVDDRYLSEYGMVRWVAGRSAARPLPLESWSYYAATYPNNAVNDVKNEVEYFTSQLPLRGIQPVRIASTYDAFMEALEEPTFDVLHVACHGDVQEDNIEKAELLITDELVNGRAKFVSVSANLVGTSARFGERRPLVFLNACEAGRLGESLTAWGGWPSRLIKAGAGAVIGASWPVRDVASSKFAVAFYDALLAGKTLSEAAVEARGAAASIGDATWLAFKVFGDPHAAKA